MLYETCVLMDPLHNKVWSDTIIKTRNNALFAGITTRLQSLTSKDKRFVILHPGGKNGFIHEIKFVFMAKKNIQIILHVNWVQNF